MLLYVLVFLGGAQLLHGEFLDAIATAEEGLRIAADTGLTALTGSIRRYRGGTRCRHR